MTAPPEGAEGTPVRTAGGPDLAVAFGRALRRRGLDVPVHAVVAFAEALSLVGVVRPEPVYWAGRSTLVRRPEDLALYDRVFDAFWRSVGQVELAASAPESVTLLLDTDEDDGGELPDEGEEPGGPTLSVRWSADEVLRHKDFALCTSEEVAQLHRLLARLRLGGALRASRRLRPAPHPRGARPDLRRTVRQALHDGGEPIRRRYREPSQRPRRVVLLVDVSGSMEPYARALLSFVHAAVVGRARVEAFTLGTRLTRITRELSWRDPDAALAAAAGAVEDWSGGTRLGEGLRAFNDRWGVRGMARGAVVVILSDGWDRGDPQVLGEQMARLHRVAYRVVWVNPLKASPGYAPLARGMAAALPYVDEFVEGHSLASIEHLADVVAR